MDAQLLEMFDLAYPQLFKGGALLMAGKQERNPMTIGWYQFGRLWNQPICAVFVRPSRYSHALVERDGVFTVAFPQDDAMKQALGFCGSKSGRDTDKKKELGLTVFPNRAGGVDSLKGNFVHVECETLGKAEFKGGLTYLDPSLRDQFYNPQKEADEFGDLHTVYYGKILAAYKTE